MAIEHIIDFLEPINPHLILQDVGLNKAQIGKNIHFFGDTFPEIESADIILVGCNEYRGLSHIDKSFHNANIIRNELYKLYYWHNDIKIIDIGNIKVGSGLQDSYSAIKMVLSELLIFKKKVIIIGGSHDITIPQYQAYQSLKKLIDATIIDAKIDFDVEGNIPAFHFLEYLFTSIPNHLRHYNHIGFQSYCTNPDILLTIDKLKFDCYRLGKVRESILEMEPILRSSHIVSIDISSIQHANAPANIDYPNGFNGEEICTLMQYAGMSNLASTIGVYGYLAQNDTHFLTAKQIAQMIWYFIDGAYKLKTEKPITDKTQYIEYKTAFTNLDTVFLQNKFTGRWWMQLEDKSFIACSYRDYLIANKNEFPERWIREMERRD